MAGLYPPVGLVGKRLLGDSPSPNNHCFVRVIHPTSKRVGFLTKKIIKVCFLNVCYEAVPLINITVKEADF